MNTTHSRRWMTVSNFLSLSRLLMAPIIVWALLNGYWRDASFLFVCGSITDLFDGYLARRLQEQTVVGQYLDPLADKVFLLASFASLAYVKLETVLLPTWFVWLVVMRELIIVGGGVVLVCLSTRVSMEPSILGKITTASYMFLILWMFLCYFAGWLPVKSFSVVLIVVATVATSSLVHYCWRGWLFFRNMPSRSMLP